MDLQTIIQASDRVRALDAIRSRLRIVAAALLGVADNVHAMPPEIMWHLSDELHGVANCLDDLQAAAR